MLNTFRCAVLAVLAFASCGAPSHAAAVIAVHAPDSGATLTDGDFTAPPKAFLAFCETYPVQCVRSGEVETVALGDGSWNELTRVNRAVNRRISPKREAPGVDIWRLGVTKGDCDAYALEKRKELVDLGWPSAALTLTVVRIETGEAHLILTVRTDRGDFVLDNLRDAILAADEVGYQYLMRQSSVHPRLWVNIDGVSRGSTRMAQAAMTRDRDLSQPATNIVLATSAASLSPTPR
jgi:predicted transglutaminase-like cysteine proteinase